MYGAGPDVLRLYQRRLRLAHGVLAGLVVATVILTTWYLIEEIHFDDLPREALQRFLLLRGVAIALCSTTLAAGVVYRVMKRDELEVRAQQEFLDRILDTTGEAILAVDPRGTVLAWNRRAETIFGYSAEEVKGRPLEDLLRRLHAGPEPAEALMEAARREGGFDSREVPLRAKDGGRLTCAVSANPIRDPAGNAAAWAVICRDITKEKELQGQVITAERLAALGEMAAAVAHEIKNPLAGIKGAMDVVNECLQTCKPEVCAPNRPVIEMIHQQIDRLTHHINDLLLFAKPLQSQPEAVSASALIDRVLTILHEEPAMGRLTIERAVPADLAVWGDPHLLQEVAMNLVLNAAQAVRQGGRLRIEGGRTPDGGASLAFQDDGPGLSERAQENLFRPFFTTKSQGTGLGLSICRKVVETHGGRLTAENTPEGGARFVVELPPPERSPLAAVEPDPPPIPFVHPPVAG